MQARESVLKDGNTSKASNRNQITNKKNRKRFVSNGRNDSTLMSEGVASNGVARWGRRFESGINNR